MSEPRQPEGASGRDVEAAVRELIRNAVEPGGARAEPGPERDPAERPTTEVPAAAPTPGNGHSPPRSPAGGRLVGPLEAFLRHPFLTVLPIVLLVGAAVAIGTQRDPEHRAEARIQVGRDNVPPFYLQSVITGSQALASTYSRAVYTEPVVQATAQGAGVPIADVRGNLDGYQVGGSTLIEVQARSTSRRAAIAMANTGAEALIRYIQQLTRNTNESRALFDQYRRATRAYHRADQRVRELIGRRGRERQLRQARSGADSARLRAEDIADRYRATTVAQTTGSELDLIAPAATTTSDRSDKLQELIVIGAVAGVVLGLGLALLRSNWSLLGAMRRR